MARSKWLLLLLLPMLFGFETNGPFRTRNPFKAADFTIGGGPAEYTSEQRCQDLGTDCIMSEPLNTSDFHFVEPGSEVDAGSCGVWYTPPDVYHDIDFQDSEGSESKEASRYYDCVGQSAVASSISDVDLPTGTGEIEYVFKTPIRGGILIQNAGDIPDGLVRVCQRHYRKFSTPFDFSNSCFGDKMTEVWGNQTALQMQEWGSSHYFQFWSAEPACTEGQPTYGWTNDVQNLEFTPDVSASDCVDNWCRIELCIETTGSDIKDLQDISFDAEVRQVGVGSPKIGTVSWTLGDYQNGCNSSAGSMSSLWPFVIFRSNGGTCDDGYNYISHAMIAGWSTDSGQTIGAACEVEGGC